MATISFELKDSNGTDVEIGDMIIAHIPEVELSDYSGEDLYYYRPGMEILGKVMLPPSKGLKLKVVKILNIHSNYELTDAVKQSIPTVKTLIDFRRTVWDWYKVTSSNP